jgi:hypothetical protein
MLNLMLLMIVPTLIALFCLFFFKGKIMLWEFFGQLLVVALVISAGFWISYAGRVSDTEIWNGKVTERKRVEVSCEHSYKCNCSTDKDGHEHCSTCYEHNYDVDWNVYATTGESLEIEREDRQGLVEPKRWDAVYPGEPFSSMHHFENYIRANPDSVLLGTKGDMEQFGKLVPEYNDKVYDYYKHDPVINMGVPNVDMQSWNWLIREVNKELGPVKQINNIVILVPTNDQAYMFALKDAWLGGKKNDDVVVIGSTDGHRIGFADVMTWSTNKAFAIDLKHKIEDIGTLDKKDDIQQAILTISKAEFVRMHMHDMKWLIRSYEPSNATLWWLFFIAVIVEAGLAFASIKAGFTEENPFGQGHYGRIRNRYRY